ncbi:MAG: Rpn family recombination-promoting nuclease/putative transposase [Muricoprocola sp.]
MGLKDSVTKDYMRESSVFADAFNFFMYNGEEVIDPSGLTEMDTTELVLPFYFDEDKGIQTESEQKYRDVLKSATVMYNDNAAYVILGVENQTDINYAMPVKNLLYDVIQYSKQVADLSRKHRVEWKQDHLGKKPKREEFLSGIYKEDKLTPVITLVIHFGAKQWDGPLSLKEMMATTDEKILSYVPDYKVNLIDPSQIAKSDMNKFKSSLREVLTYIKLSMDGDKLKKYLENEERLESLEVSAAKVIKTITNSKFDIPEGAEVINVCKAEHDMIERSKFELLVDMVKHDELPIEIAAARVKMTVEQFKERMDRLFDKVI